MSRPISRKGSAKGKNAKPKKKTPKQQIAELTEENEKLKTDLEFLKVDSTSMRDKLDSITRKLVASVRKDEFGLTDQSDLLGISTDTLIQMIDKLVVKRRIYDVSVESRAEELEIRLTEMSMIVAKMTTKTNAYEMGLQTLARSTDPAQMKDEIHTLILIAGQEYNTFAANDPAKTDADKLNGYHDLLPDASVLQSLQNAHLLNLTPPKKKLAGETPVKNMHRELKSYIIQELSQEKVSGSDWRRFAVRVEIDTDTIAGWVGQKLRYPMGNVFQAWEQDAGASVRMLHRHLTSPQMRCTLAAKRVSDFYQVD